MNCTGAIEKLGEHLDGVLPKSEATELEAHLASCAACRAEMEELRRMLAAVKELPRVPAPRGFAAGVMAQIRAESAAQTVAVPTARVTPIRGFTIVTRLAASIAAIFLVWVGVRAIHVQPAPETGNVPVTQTSSARPESGSQLAQEQEKAASGPVLKTHPDSTDTRENGTLPSTTPPPAAPAEMAKAKGPANAAGGYAPDKDGGSWEGKPGAPKDIAVQRITVYSSDIGADAQQVRNLLADSGYTYSTQKQAILVRVPASEAAQLLASLGSGVKGGFRADDRQSLESFERLKKRKEAEAPKPEDKNVAGRNKENDELLADADELKEALRRHVEETRRQIQRSAEEKKKSSEKALTAGAANGVAGGGGGKREGARKEMEDGGRDHNEEAEGKKSDSKSGSGLPAGGELAGADDSGEGRGAHQGGAFKKDEPYSGDAPDGAPGRSRRELADSEKLADALQALEKDRKLQDSEEAVVLYIEFEGTPPPAADPAAAPAKK